MNFKDLLLPLLLALVATWAIQYFFFSPKQENRTEIATDRRFTAPSSMQVAEPLNFDIDFVDTPPSRPKQITEIHVPYGTIHFSNDGGIIDLMVFKRVLAGKEALITTIVPTASRERGAFLVALNGFGSTPFYYDLIEKKEEKDRTSVSFKGESGVASVIKQFIVHHDTYTIDLKVTVEPKNKANVRARVLFPAPMAEGALAGAVQAILFSGNDIEKKPLTALANFGVELPSIFGLEDHYFLHTLIKDPQQFANRAYFKVESDTAQAILQGNASSEKMNFELSFYCGPKEMKALSAVDKRLESVLDYGWFSPISKLLLYLLIFFYGLLKSYGLAIIAVTVLVRLIMVPFTLKGEQSQRKHMEAQKKLQYIEQKYKHDPEVLAKEKAEFAKKHGLPGLLGCLPLLLQIPVFIGLQRVLTNAIELYKAPFLWVPDLSARDPYYIFPALVGLGMVVQMAQTGDPRQRVANILLAIIIAAVTANLSAGLTLFICVSTLLGLAQTYLQKAFKV
jgi:YidC/Oxa1 family membrane protein insertase